MYLLGREKAFYQAPQYPPWATLPAESLSPDLRSAKSLLPSRPTSIREDSGAFIPLSHYEGTEPDTRYLDPHTVGKSIDVFLFNGKHPVSLQLIRWDGLRSAWGGSESQGAKGKKAKKADWVDGFRWSCLEAYLKHLHAYSTGDINTLKLFTTGNFAQEITTSVRNRFRSSLSASRFDGHKKPGWNVAARPEDKVTYRWVFHGPYEGPGGETGGSGCRIRSIRARENWQSIMNPPVGSRYSVQALVSFDTMQSLQVYSNDELIREEGPRRVREDYVLEKRLFQPMPWAIRCRIWDRAGVITPRLKDEME